MQGCQEHTLVDASSGCCFECIAARLRSPGATPTSQCALLHELHDALKQCAELHDLDWQTEESLREALLTPLEAAIFDPGDDVPSASARVLALSPLNEVDVVPELLIAVRVRLVSGAVSEPTLEVILEMLTHKRFRRRAVRLGDCRALLSALWTHAVLESGSAAGAALINALVELSSGAALLTTMVESSCAEERSCRRLLGHLGRAAPLRARLVRTLLLAASSAQAQAAPLARTFGALFVSADGEHAALPRVLQQCLLSGASGAAETVRRRAEVERERLDVTALIVALATVPAFATAFVQQDVVEFIIEGLREENGSLALQGVLVHALQVILDASGAHVDRALAAAGLSVLTRTVIIPALEHKLAALANEALHLCRRLLEQHCFAGCAASARHELPLLSAATANALAACVGKHALLVGTPLSVDAVAADVELLALIVPSVSPDAMASVAQILHSIAAVRNVQLIEQLASLCLALLRAAGDDATVVERIVDIIDAHIAGLFLGAALLLPDAAVKRFAECILSLVATASSEDRRALVIKLIDCDFHIVVIQLTKRAAQAPSRQLLLSELFVSLFAIVGLVDGNNAIVSQRWLECVHLVPTSSAERARLLAEGAPRSDLPPKDWTTAVEICFACWVCTCSNDLHEVAHALDRYLALATLPAAAAALSSIATSHIIAVATGLLDVEMCISREAEASLARHLLIHQPVQLHRLSLVLALHCEELHCALITTLRSWVSGLAVEESIEAQERMVTGLIVDASGEEGLLCQRLLWMAEAEKDERNVPALLAIRLFAELSSTCADELDSVGADRFLHAQLRQCGDGERGARRCLDEIAGATAALVEAQRAPSRDGQSRCVGAAGALLSMQRLSKRCARRVLEFAAERSSSSYSDAAPISALRLINAVLASPSDCARELLGDAFVRCVRTIALTPSSTESARHARLRYEATRTLLLLVSMHTEPTTCGADAARHFMAQLPLPLVVAATTAASSLRSSGSELCDEAGASAEDVHAKQRALSLLLGVARCTLSLRREPFPLEPAAWDAVRRMHFELLQAAEVGSGACERCTAVAALEHLLGAHEVAAHALCCSPWQSRAVALLLDCGEEEEEEELSDVALDAVEIALLAVVDAASPRKMDARAVKRLVARFIAVLLRESDGDEEADATAELSRGCFAALFALPHLCSVARAAVLGPLDHAISAQKEAEGEGEGEAGGMATEADSVVAGSRQSRQWVSAASLLNATDADQQRRRCASAMRHLRAELRTSAQ